MASRIRGAPRPRPGPKHEVIRVKTPTWRYFLCLSRAFWGQKIHFFCNRSSECSADHAACEGCGKFWPQKWKGYLHCVDHATGKEVFLELTPTASEMLEQLVPSGQTLRGINFKVSKTKGGSHGRYLIELVYREIDVETLPNEKDPVPVLRMLWEWEKKSGQKTDTNL